MPRCMGVCPLTTPGDPTLGFTRWAAALLQVAERTIQHDLRLAALGLGGVAPGRVLPAPPPPEAPASLRVAYALRASRTLAATLAELTATLTPELPFAPPQRAAVHQALCQLQTHVATLQATWLAEERTADAAERGAA